MTDPIRKNWIVVLEQIPKHKPKNDMERNSTVPVNLTNAYDSEEST